MKHFGMRSSRLSVLTLAVLFTLGCAGSVPLVDPVKPPTSNVGTPPGAADAPVFADRIVGIRIEDVDGGVTVGIKGNGPFRDYQFQRSGDKGFVLDLGGFPEEGVQASLPVYSERLVLSHDADRSPTAATILGSLSKPLDLYVVDAVGDELLIRLYLKRDEPPVRGAEKAKMEKKPVSSSAPARVMTAGAATPSSPAPPAPLPSGFQSSSRTARLPRVGSAMPVEASKREYVGKPVSLDLLEADLKNVLRLLADISGTNIVIEPDVSGRVTLKVEKVPWDQVLDMVLAMNDLGREQVGNVVRVARLTKLKQEWDQQIAEIRAKQELIEVSKDVGEITTAYLTINYAQAADIAARISEGKSDKGKVSVDERSSLVIYTDYPNRIEDAKRLVARLDKTTAQVLIEARLVTTTADFTRSLGTSWNLSFLHTGGTQPSADVRNFYVNSPQSPFFEFYIAQVIGDTLATVDFKLSAYETTQQVNVIAAPKVLTINNVRAVITQGKQIPYLVRSDLGSSSTQFKDATVELQVVPHITPDQKVRLEIQAKQDEPTAQEYKVGDSTVPGIDTRKITTELLVDDGKVVVIGGVMRNRDTESRRATPGLNKVPILGWLFKEETTTKERTELLIFISPKIVETTGRPVGS